MNNQKPTILILSDFPSVEEPTKCMFIKHRTEILKKEYNVIVVSTKLTKNRSKITCSEEDDLKHYDLKLHSPVPKIRSAILDYKAFKLLSNIIVEHAPFIIEVHFSSYRSWIARKLSKKYNTPYIVVEHASFFEEKINHFYYGPKIKKALNNADKIIAVSYPLKETIEKYIKRKIEVVPNIVSTDKFKITKNRIHNQIPQLVTVGSLDLKDKKGYENLLVTLSIIKRKGYCFQLKVAGNGPNEDNLINKRDKLGLINEVEFIGTVNNDELVHLFNESDFFVSSSKIETFGVAIVEAMSCGLPIVATYSGGPATFVNDHVGVLADISPEDIAAKVEYMLNNYSNYDPWNIRQKVIDNFSEYKYIENVNKIYNQFF